MAAATMAAACARARVPYDDANDTAPVVYRTNLYKSRPARPTCDDSRPDDSRRGVKLDGRGASRRSCCDGWDRRRPGLSSSTGGGGGGCGCGGCGGGGGDGGSASGRPLRRSLMRQLMRRQSQRRDQSLPSVCRVARVWSSPGSLDGHFAIAHDNGGDRRAPGGADDATVLTRVVPPRLQFLVYAAAV
uniref:Uncharacterized protein n=1 Tax=Plectus sambesii TaxID=2011161 RepID=A0A914V4J1_9BILA